MEDKEMDLSTNASISLLEELHRIRQQAEHIAKQKQLIQDSERLLAEQDKALRDRLTAGESTGDRLLDYCALKIGLADHAASEQCATFNDKLNDLQNRLAGRVGEFVLIASFIEIRMAVLREETLLFDLSDMSCRLPTTEYIAHEHGPSYCASVNAGPLALPEGQNSWSACLMSMRNVEILEIGQERSPNEGGTLCDIYVGDEEVSAYFSQPREGESGDDRNLRLTLFSNLAGKLGRDISRIPVISDWTRSEAERVLANLKELRDERNRLRRAVLGRTTDLEGIRDDLKAIHATNKKILDILGDIGRFGLVAVADPLVRELKEDPLD